MFHKCLATLPERFNILLCSVLISKTSSIVPCVSVLTRSGTKFPTSQGDPRQLLKASVSRFNNYATRNIIVEILG